MKTTDPTPEHRWLAALVGEWTYEMDCPEGQSQGGAGGREVVRAVGDLWVVAEISGTMPGGVAMTGLMTLGYDTARRRFVGTWIGSPMAHMFVYEGARSGDRLTLDTVGPSFTDPSKSANYRDVIEVHGPDERSLVSQVQGDDGSWSDFMRADYRRVKPRR